MQNDVMKSIIRFVFNYIWIVCALLILLECFSVAFGAVVLMKRTTEGVMDATNGEISARVSGVLQLMTGLSQDTTISDTSLPLFDRAKTLMPLQESFQLYMIAMTDEECNVVSADEEKSPEKPTNLMFREYMQRVYSTGKYEITDPFVAGADEKTINYTIAVPIVREEKVAGTVFGSIYFEDIQKTIDRNSLSYGRSLHLFGRDNTVIAGSGYYPSGTAFEEISDNALYLNTSMEEIVKNMNSRGSGSYWVLRPNGLFYVLYQNVPPADWTLFYRIDFISMVLPLLPVTITKILFYIIVCVLISSLGKKYLEKRLYSINRLLEKMSSMQRELFSTDSPENVDYTTLLDISHQGLVDQLTGLPTRTVLLDKMNNLDYDNCCGAVMFIDLDNLKHINDKYGHKAGDLAISSFSKILKELQVTHNVIVARYGGDEFIMVVSMQEKCDITDFAEELCKSLGSQITVENQAIAVNASIGIAIFPQDGVKTEDLICKADIALYDAKHQGKNRYSFYGDTGIE